MNALKWLLESDPAIRWQAMRDLTDSSPADVQEQRASVAHEGLASEILAAQNADGSWRREGEPVWASTLFTLLLLRSTGVAADDPAVVSAIARAESQLRWDDAPGWWDLRPQSSGGKDFFVGEEEPCINGGVLAMGAYFGHPSEELARRLVAEQLPDGGWNCEAPKSQVSSFHSTMCVLEGLLEYQQAVGDRPEIVEARARGEEYLLQRVLFRRRSTGEIASREFLVLAFPPRYHYDILRALDYFRAAGVRPDPRMQEAVVILEDRREKDAKWRLDARYDEVQAIGTGESIGEPSRWNTLRALRVLRWFGRLGACAD